VPQRFTKDLQYYKFCAYGFLKNLNFFEPFLLLFLVEKGFSFLQIGTLYGIQSLATNILEIPTGILADAAGRRRAMVFSMLSYLSAFPVFYFSRTFGPFVAAMILLAFGDAFRTGTHKAMIFEYLRIKGWKDQKVFYYGHTRSWSQLGSALSSVIAAGIVFFSGIYRYIFLASVVPYALDLVLLLTYPKELDGTVKKFQVKALTENFDHTLREFAEAIKNPRIIRAVVNSASYSGYFDALKDYLQPVLKTFALTLPLVAVLEPSLGETKKSALVIGVMYLVLKLMTAGAARYAGRFAEAFREPHRPMNITLVTALIVGALTGLSFAAGWTVAAIVLFIGLYLIHNLRRPLGEAYITETLKDDILASALSTESQVSTLLTALLAPVIGFLADLWGVGLALTMVSLLLLLLFPLYQAKPVHPHSA